MKRVLRHREAAMMSLVAAGVVMIGGLVPVQAKAQAAHPELTAQEQLIDCAECHQQATPEVVKEWNDSLHGIGMVKCYQCHGTFESFAVTPSRDNCATCHADKMENHAEKMGKAADTPCWECHVPHTFHAKK